MIDLSQLQKEVYDNKVTKGFNTTDVAVEFCLMNTEVAEAFKAYRYKQSDIGEELADIAIYLLGLAQMLNVDLEKNILEKIEKNRHRVYKGTDGIMLEDKASTVEKNTWKQDLLRHETDGEAVTWTPTNSMSLE